MVIKIISMEGKLMELDDRLFEFTNGLQAYDIN